MAKMNKYWGMVAIGALTAAAAGAVAAVLMKKKPVAEGPDFEDDFDDYFEDEDLEDEKDAEYEIFVDETEGKTEE